MSAELQAATNLDALLPKAVVVRTVALSYPTIWRRVRDGKFPAPVQISKGRIAWRQSDVRAWLASLSTSTIQPKAHSNGRPRKRGRR